MVFNKDLPHNDCIKLFNVLESVIPQRSDVIVIYSGIWSFADNAFGQASTCI